jgi:succinate dehydrogenase/fumarate reductase flavoprotein subunit
MPKDCNDSLAYDVIVVGSGGAGLTSAIVAAHQGLRVIVFEKTCFIGGTTAMSGGGVWIPSNALMTAAGHADTVESALCYLRQVMGQHYDDVAVKTFISRGSEALAYLCHHSDLAFSTRSFSPDYYSELSGATSTSRAVDTIEIDGRLLGSDLNRLRPARPETLLFGGMVVNGLDIEHFRNAFRSFNSFCYLVRRLTSYAKRRLLHGQETRLVMGRAMVARMLATLNRFNVDVVDSAPVRDLTWENGRVVGVQVEMCGTLRDLRAARGVILATGGFGCNKDMVRAWVPFPEQHLAVGANENTGDGLSLGISAGAAVSDEVRDSAYWVPTSVWRKRDGTSVTFPHLVSDRAKPGIIAVGGDGRRFVNEADSYHDFVRAMHLNNARGIASAFLICDARALKRYGLGYVRPWPFPKRQLIADGYLMIGATIADLARELDISSYALDEAVKRYNSAAVAGRDPEFGKGSSIYNRAMGDPIQRPNPCLAPIMSPPFYAIRVFPGNLGTSRGLRTDQNARVLDQAEQPVAGLYAVGNDADSVFRGSYPGPGASLGPALTAGYLAAMHLAEQAGLKAS